LVPDIKLTEEDIEVSLLELKRRVGSPLITMKTRKRLHGEINIEYFEGNEEA
tara:strand:+ start:237 stop:392 length:156 start_codon:yes stop_codon:yes gene_type:complete